MPTRSRPVAVATSVVATLLVLAVIAYLAVITGAIPANADAPPGRLETWAAKRSLRATLARETSGLRDPVPANDSTLTRGVHLYGTYCAICHGASDAKPSAVARGLYQHAPQFAKDDVTDDPVAVTYWKITHGIRLTGMPAFDSTLTADERWTIANFLAHQNDLPPTAKAAWLALPSAVQKP